jgi:hypothetical protein
LHHRWQIHGKVPGWVLRCHYLSKQNLTIRGIKTVILWGGVQATNTKAVNFYKKLGYRFIASFWHDEKDNYDMVKEL